MDVSNTENHWAMPTMTQNTQKTKWRPSIRFNLVLMNFILLFLLFPTISFILFHELSNFRDAQLNRSLNQLQSAMQESGISLARSLSLSAEQAIAGYDYTFLTNMLTQIVEKDPDVSYALIMDPERRAIAHNRIDQIGIIQNDAFSLKAQELLKRHFTPSQSGNSPPEFVSFTNDDIAANDRGTQPIFEIIVPVYNGLLLAGVLRCGISMAKLQVQTNQMRNDWSYQIWQFKKFVFSMTGLFFLIGFLVAYIFTVFFVRSTRLLSLGVHEVASGNLDIAIETDSMFCSEFESYASGFNEMTRQLRTSLKTLDEYNKSLEDKVQARTSELKDAQAELLHKAHEAGMAEMAVGVLHNIGNAITPAKIEASLLHRRIKESPFRSKLPGALQQIQRAIQHPDQLSDTEKKRLMEICQILPESIQELTDVSLVELHKICTKHEHIEEIIHLQMRYAKLLGSYEETDINFIVQDALTMLDEAITRRFIQVKLSLGAIPPVKIEKAKMIQIIINLIKNGYEAMDDLTLPHRRLHITTSVTEGTPQMVRLSIKDTGCGFTADAKAKMFQFGYTTKSTGSGFGLHSCANFLIANNGTLTAASGGPGKGAEFVVQLPLSA